MFVALLAVLALGVYSTTTLTVQTVANERRVNDAQLASESGMEFVRQQVASVSIPYNTQPVDLFAQLAVDLQTQLNGSTTLGGGNIEVDAANSAIYIPARTANAISLGSNAGAFRTSVKVVGTQLNVTANGFDGNGSFQRDIALNYAIATHASQIFDFGVASKGPITLTGNVAIKGTAGNEVFGSVLVVSDNNTTPLTMIGNGAISGDVSLTRTDPTSISVSTNSTIASYAKSNSQFWTHVHDKVTEPEFPIIDTAIFKQYATNIIDSTSSGSSSTPVGGSGDAAGFVGLTYFNIQNNCTVKAYDSVNSTTLGSVSALGQTNAGGNLNGLTYSGEIRYKTSFSMNQTTVTKLTKVTSTLSFNSSTTPSDAINKSNYNGPSGTSETFPAGKYYFQTFSVPSGKTVIFSGPVELYVNGSCNITGDVVSYQDHAWNTKIRMVCSAGVDINGPGTKPLYVDVYAPLSPLNINNRSNVYGSFIMNGISVSNSNVIIDRAIKANGGATDTPVATQTAGTTGTTTLTGSYYKNIYIKANTNPTFTGNQTFDGVVYVEWPNKVEFAGNTKINGIVVSATDGNNNIGLDPTVNYIKFTGNVTATPLSSLPATTDFTLALRNLSGGFVLSPGFGVAFTGNFGTVSGSIVASKLDFTGNAGGTVAGTIINLNNTPFTISGNSNIVIQSAGTTGYPAGVYFGSRFDPLPDSYLEVTP